MEREREGNNEGQSSSSSGAAEDLDRSKSRAGGKEKQPVVAASPLAANLQAVYEAVCEGRGVHVMINDWISVSLNIRVPKASTAPGVRRYIGEATNGYGNGYGPGEEGEKARQPYETLLPLCDERDALARLAPNSNAQIAALLRAANPLKSFEELADETDIPLAQVYRIAQHLCYWGFAKIIHTICRSNAYMVAPDARIGDAELAVDFASKFAGYKLLQVLGYFSRGITLHEVMESVPKTRHQALLEMTVWLLQHDYLIQLNQYIHLVEPKKNEEGEELQPHAVYDPTDHVYTLFRRLHPLFDGSIHLRELVWQEQLDAGEVAEVVATYKLAICLR
ncbi:unnamed protein product [Chrysoparadoxa australica]